MKSSKKLSDILQNFALPFPDKDLRHGTVTPFRRKRPSSRTRRHSRHCDFARTSSSSGILWRYSTDDHCGHGFLRGRAGRLVRRRSVFRALRVPDHGNSVRREARRALLQQLLHAARAAHLPALLRNPDRILLGITKFCPFEREISGPHSRSGLVLELPGQLADRVQRLAALLRHRSLLVARNRGAVLPGLAVDRVFLLAPSAADDLWSCGRRQLRGAGWIAPRRLPNCCLCSDAGTYGYARYRSSAGIDCSWTGRPFEALAMGWARCAGYRGSNNGIFCCKEVLRRRHRIHADSRVSASGGLLRSHSCRGGHGSAPDSDRHVLRSSSAGVLWPLQLCAVRLPPSNHLLCQTARVQSQQSPGNIWVTASWAIAVQRCRRRRNGHPCSAQLVSIRVTLSEAETLLPVSACHTENRR